MMRKHIAHKQIHILLVYYQHAVTVLVPTARLISYLSPTSCDVMISHSEQRVKLCR